MTRPYAAQSHPVTVSLGRGGVGCESGGLWRGGGGGRLEEYDRTNVVRNHLVKVS